MLIDRPIWNIMFLFLFLFFVFKKYSSYAGICVPVAVRESMFAIDESLQLSACDMQLIVGVTKAKRSCNECSYVIRDVTA